MPSPATSPPSWTLLARHDSTSAQTAHSVPFSNFQIPVSEILEALPRGLSGVDGQVAETDQWVGAVFP